MNQMLVLKCFINVDTSMLSEILQIYDPCTFSTLHTTDYLHSVTQVPLMEPIDSYYMDIFPILTSVTQVPLVEPINSYYMITFPKLTSGFLEPLVEPISSYYMAISQN